MNIEAFRDYCMAKPAVTDGFPFDESTLVFKVEGKMFALVNVDLYDFANLKCDPEWAVQLREEHEGISPGYHMNKKHWNSVDTKGLISDKMLIKLIDHSYDLVVLSLPKKIREVLRKG